MLAQTDDISIDIPKTLEHVATVLASLITADVVPLSYLNDAPIDTLMVRTHRGTARHGRDDDTACTSCVFLMSRVLGCCFVQSGEGARLAIIVLQSLRKSRGDEDVVTLFKGANLQLVSWMKDGANTVDATKKLLNDKARHHKARSIDINT